MFLSQYLTMCIYIDVHTYLYSPYLLLVVDSPLGPLLPKVVVNEFKPWRPDDTDFSAPVWRTWNWCIHL